MKPRHVARIAHVARVAALFAVALAAVAGLDRPSALAQPSECGTLEHGPLRPGEIVRGRIDDCRRAETWTFEGVRGQAVMIGMEQTVPPSFASIELDPFLRLFGPGDGGEETLATQNDDGGYGYNAQIQYILGATGRFRIVAAAIGDSAGDFQLWYTFVGLGASDRGAIRSGEIVSGHVDAANSEDAWTFDGRAGQRVMIAMRRTRPLSLESLFLDPLLFLLRRDESGVEVVEAISDDEQNELDALILIRLEHDGRYRIVASRLGDSFGRYDLTFQLDDGER